MRQEAFPSPFPSSSSFLVGAKNQLLFSPFPPVTRMNSEHRPASASTRYLLSVPVAGLGSVSIRAKGEMPFGRMQTCGGFGMEGGRALVVDWGVASFCWDFEGAGGLGLQDVQRRTDICTCDHVWTYVLSWVSHFTV